jgi:hypothetical protein
MSYLRSFNEASLCKLILQTNKELFLTMPLIHPELLAAIHSVHSKHNGKVSINIGLDFSPETFRQGYGEMEAFEKTNLNNYNCQNISDNRVSFIITDDIGYFLFIESRYLIPAEKSTINAVKIDPTTIVRLKQHFFNRFDKAELKDQLSNAIIDESIVFKNVEEEFRLPSPITTQQINNKIIKKVGDELKINPPIKPDFKRMIEFYSTRFQYAKLVFSGANLQHKKIEIPSGALPIRDAELKNRLETKLNLFSNEEFDNLFKDLNALKDIINKLREDFFTPLKSRNESIIITASKGFMSLEVDKIKKQIPQIASGLLVKIAGYIDQAKVRIIADLTEFYLANAEAIWKNNNLLLSAAEDYKRFEAQNLATETAGKIKWPKAYQLVSELKLSLFFSNITKEDLSNKELINELGAHGLLNDDEMKSLGIFGKAIGTK